MEKSEWIGKAKEVLIESFFEDTSDARTIEELKTKLFCKCAQFGLLYDKHAKKLIKEEFIDSSPDDKSFKDFKGKYLENFEKFLREVIK